MKTVHEPRGNLPTAFACFLHFDLSFMLWVLLGALSVYISEELGLSPAEKGLMVAVPILTGSLLRLPLGLLSDTVGGKKIGAALLAFLFIPLALGWQAGGSLPTLVAVGLLLGTAGGSFAVALPLASRWFPPHRQGLVMGIAAAGNSGTVITNLAAPRLAEAVGWANVLGLAMLPLAIGLLVFLLVAKEAPRGPRQRAVDYLQAPREGDLWWLCLMYSVTFGGYVGLSSFLPLLFRDQYGLSPLDTGALTAMGAFAGSAVRPLGGYLADHVGGARLLFVLLLAIGAVYSLASHVPPVAIMAGLMVTGMACMGLGNGAVFQLVPRRFSTQVGTATGIVGAVGGLGGFLLPVLLGTTRQLTGGFELGLLALALLAFVALAALGLLVASRDGWRGSWRMTPAAGPAQPVSVRATHQGMGQAMR